MTTALEGSEWSGSCPGLSLPPGKTRYPLYKRLGGRQDRSGQVRNISSLPGFDPRTVQSVASRYTDYATRPTICMDGSVNSRTHRRRGQRLESAAVRLLGLRFRILPAAGMSVTCECFQVDVSATGYFPSVVCLSVIVKPRRCEGPGPLGSVAPWGGGLVLI